MKHKVVLYDLEAMALEFPEEYAMLMSDTPPDDDEEVEHGA